MAEPVLLVSQSEAIRTLTLNRPAALNSFSGELVQQIHAALESAAGDPAVRCVVLTGAGRGFCAGQDLSDPGASPAGPGEEPRDLGDLLDRRFRPLLLRLRSMPVPVVAAVNGVAAGAGANVALCCDIVVAARSATFIQAFSRIGLLPDCGGTWLLPRLAGRARALGMALLADKLPADEAERIGLIWRSVPDDALAGEAQAIASRLATLPTRALVATRAAFDAAQHLDFGGALAEESRRQRELGFAGDYLEGCAAFLAKRPPRFSDR